MPFAFLFGLYVTPMLAFILILTSLRIRGTFSTIFLYLVDVKKSRIECDQFVEAEMERKAFKDVI